MKKFTFLSLAAVLAGIWACGNPKSNTPKTDNTQNKDSVRYVAFPDADTFQSDWSKENTVIVHWPSDPMTLHPTNENNANRHFVAQYTHSTLLTTDFETLELIPDVAKSLPSVSPDGLTYEYEIRPEATWDDGSPVTAEDIVFTYKVNKCLLVANPFAKAYLENLLDIVPDAANNRKMKFVMARKYILNDYLTTDFALLQRKFFDPENVLGKYTYAQVSDPKLAENPPKDLSDWANKYNSAEYGSEVKNLAGLGPYKVESWDRGQTIVLTKKPNHWTSRLSNPTGKHQAFPEKIIFRTVLDETAVLLEMKKQGMDVSTFLTTKSLLELGEDPTFNRNYHHDFVPFFNLSMASMNNRPDGIKRKKLFTDKNVRRAMAHLTPVDDIIEVIYFGKAKRQNGPVFEMKKEYNKDLKPVEFNIEKAKQLLKDAGWADTDGDNILDKMIDGQKVKFEFELAYQSTSPITKDMADLMAEAMIKAGIKANPVGYDVKVIIQMGQTHDFDMIFAAFGGGSAPEDYKQLWHTESWANKGSNYAGFGNAETDALIDSIRFELDESKRIPMVQRFQEKVCDEQPVIFMVSTYRKVAIHKRFGNAAGFFDRPGVGVNNLKLLYGGIIQANSSVQ
jgi:peptide/nickel transport system substrate-binding protein